MPQTRKNNRMNEQTKYKVDGKEIFAENWMRNTHTSRAFKFFFVVQLKKEI